MLKTKVCSRCKKEKELTDFSKNKVKPDGFQYHCKQCQSKIAKKHYVNNKKAYIDRAKKAKKRIAEYIKEVKQKNSCKCGEDHIAALAFHHKDRATKLFEVSSFSKRGKSLRCVKEEIEKCVVMCSNCHLKLHYEERN